MLHFAFYLEEISGRYIPRRSKLRRFHREKEETNPKKGTIPLYSTKLF